MNSKKKFLKFKVIKDNNYKDIILDIDMFLKCFVSSNINDTKENILGLIENLKLKAISSFENTEKIEEIIDKEYELLVNNNKLSPSLFGQIFMDMAGQSNLSIIATFKDYAKNYNVSEYLPELSKWLNKANLNFLDEQKVKQKIEGILSNENLDNSLVESKNENKDDILNNSDSIIKNSEIEIEKITENEKLEESTYEFPYVLNLKSSSSINIANKLEINEPNKMSQEVELQEIKKLKNSENVEINSENVFSESNNKLKKIANKENLKSESINNKIDFLEFCKNNGRNIQNMVNNIIISFPDSHSSPQKVFEIFMHTYLFVKNRRSFKEKIDFQEIASPYSEVILLINNQNIEDIENLNYSIYINNCVIINIENDTTVFTVSISRNETKVVKIIVPSALKDHIYRFEMRVYIPIKYIENNIKAIKKKNNVVQNQNSNQLELNVSLLDEYDDGNEIDKTDVFHYDEYNDSYYIKISEISYKTGYIKDNIINLYINYKTILFAIISEINNLFNLELNFGYYIYFFTVLVLFTAVSLTLSIEGIIDQELDNYLLFGQFVWVIIAYLSIFSIDYGGKFLSFMVFIASTVYSIILFFFNIGSTYTNLEKIFVSGNTIMFIWLICFYLLQLLISYYSFFRTIAIS